MPRAGDLQQTSDGLPKKKTFHAKKKDMPKTVEIHAFLQFRLKGARPNKNTKLTVYRNPLKTLEISWFPATGACRREQQPTVADNSFGKLLKKVARVFSN